MNARRLTVLVALSTLACDGLDAAAPSLAHGQRSAPLEIGEARPRLSERRAAGSVTEPITRRSARFEQLRECRSTSIVFKDEERTGADRLMSSRLCAKLQRLQELAEAEWSGANVRVTEAWDEDGEHHARSLHYEGRAVDLTTSDRDPEKLGRLAALAVDAGFDWVYRERTHVHASVR